MQMRQADKIMGQSVDNAPRNRARMVAILLLALGRGFGERSLVAEAARNRHKRKRQRQRGSPRPTGSVGMSTSVGIDMRQDDIEAIEHSASYFERNGIKPPPLIPRNRRVQTQTSENEATLSELDYIIEDAKYGDDANARLRYDLLGRHDGEIDKYSYDKHSYPWEYVWYNQTGSTMTGVPIEININFHRVFSVDIVNSVMDLVVWFRLVWVDPRLTWDPKEYGGLNKTWFWVGDGAAGGEMSEIWTPDIELWNMNKGLKDSLEDSYARVSYDGTVCWGRPGHLRPTCKFVGLDTFPFDKLTCAMEFGSWTQNGKYLGVEKYNNSGYTMGGSQTAGESYAEYTFATDPVTCLKHIYQYKTGDLPVLFYNVTVERSWQPYARGYIATQVILNFVGFSAFWLPPNCRERMGLSITSMVAALASEIVIASKMPSAAEMTWVAKFHLLSMTFAIISLVESVLVLYFYYKRCEDLVPEWYTLIKNWYIVRQARKQGREVKRRSTQFFSRTKDMATERTINAVDALHNTTDAIASRVKEATRKSSAGDDVANDETLRSSNETSPDRNMKASSSQPVRLLRLQSRSGGNSGVPMRNFGSMMSTPTLLSTRAVMGAIPKNAHDFHDEQEMENNMKWKLVSARVDDVARFWIPLAFIVSLSIILAEVY